MIQQTLCLIKPDATKRHLIGKILSHLEENGLTIKALKKVQLNQAQAEGFYAEHQGKPFFEPLIEFMISAPIVAVVLEGENAMSRYRELMGATDPEKRQAGTLPGSLPVLHIHRAFVQRHAQSFRGQYLLLFR